MNSPQHWFRWQESVLVLDIALQPGGKRDEFVGLHGESLKIRIQAPPIDGRANAQLVAFLADSFGVARSAVALVRGAASRRKLVQITAPHAIPDALQLLGLTMPSGKSRK